MNYALNLIYHIPHKKSFHVCFDMNMFNGDSTDICVYAWSRQKVQQRRPAMVSLLTSWPITLKQVLGQ